MKKEIRYKDYRIGRDAYTVKLTHSPNSHYTPVVVRVMEWHVPPRNLWERITEWWKYDINDYLWNPLLTETSLDAYCTDKCKFITAQRIAIKKGDKEWETF